MRKSRKSGRAYRSFRREFTALHDSGCRLYYPGDREIMPEDLAETIVCDPGATYMRDTVCDREGKVVGVHFMRIQIHK